jgi:2-oxoglutarate ferredoxin oxidoreductase subunit beta
MTPQVTVKDLKVPHANDWCPGCGDFGILNSMYQAIAQLGIAPHQLAMFGGIGCSGKTPYYVNCYGVHTLHGRVLPVATGAKLANPELTVVAVGGDGDGLAIGAGHFVNAGRRNVDMTYILFNNEVYGLTKGQASPTLPMGLQPKSLPEPNIQGQVNSLMLAMTSGFTWIGRGYSYNVKQLIELMKAAVKHPGLSYLEVLQPCPTYNNLHNKEYYSGDDLASGRTRLYDIADEGYDPVIPADDDGRAMDALLARFVVKVREWGDQIPTGVFYENRAFSTFGDRIKRLTPSYAESSPARRTVSDGHGRGIADLTAHFDEVRV